MSADTAMGVRGTAGIDGLIEARHAGIDDGVARPATVVAEAGHPPVERLCGRLLDSITGGQVDDDIALLAVRCPPASKA